MRKIVNGDPREGRELISFLSCCFVCVHDGEGFTVRSFMWIDIHNEEKRKEWMNTIAKVC